jgi:hypothetical protein
MKTNASKREVTRLFIQHLILSQRHDFDAEGSSSLGFARACLCNRSARLAQRGARPLRRQV